MQQGGSRFSDMSDVRRRSAIPARGYREENSSKPQKNDSRETKEKNRQEALNLHSTAISKHHSADDAYIIQTYPALGRREIPGVFHFVF